MKDKHSITKQYLKMREKKNPKTKLFERTSDDDLNSMPEKSSRSVRWTYSIKWYDSID